MLIEIEIKDIKDQDTFDAIETVLESLLTDGYKFEYDIHEHE